VLGVVCLLKTYINVGPGASTVLSMVGPTGRDAIPPYAVQLLYVCPDSSINAVWNSSVGANSTDMSKQSSLVRVYPAFAIRALEDELLKQQTLLNEVLKEWANFKAANTLPVPTKGP